MQFRWNDWNTEHIGKHGIRTEEAEIVVRSAAYPFPMRYPDEKWFVWGRGSGGRLLQVLYILDPDETVYVIHVRLLTETEKRRYRRRKR